MRSLIAAFSMYSRIPVPRMDWEKERPRYTLCWFPLVGAVLGAALWLAYWAAERLSLGTALRGAVLTALPVLLTGGIHVDGLLDTLDARHSWRAREERLRILKDPHVGAFAIIFGIVYFLLIFGGYTEVRKETLPAAAGAFVFSRALSGWSVMMFPKATQEGTLYDAASASPRPVRGILTVECLLAAAGIILLSPVCGTAAVAAGLLVFAYYYGMSRRVFGGITGDIAGYFLCLCELMMLLAAVLAGKVWLT